MPSIRAWQPHDNAPPFSGCQIKAEIKGFLLRHRLFQCKHRFLPNFELKDFPELTFTLCIVMPIFQHFSFGPPLENMKKKLSKETQILRGFTKSKKKHMLKISGVYLIGNPEICQDPPSCGQDDQTLSIHKKNISKKKKSFFQKNFLKIF